MTVRAELARAADFLAQRGVETPQVDAEFLLAHALSLSRTGLALAQDRRLMPGELARFEPLLERRGAREPLAYVLGEWGFRRLTLRTDRRALVPRPETEVVVERCLELLAPLAEPRVLDLGTGTGAIALAIADEHGGARVVALDASEDALALARENLDRTGLGARVELVRGDLAEAPGGDFDLVVANPPYVDADEHAALPPEVRDWEPFEALVAADATDQVMSAAQQALKAGGVVVLETADSRAGAVARRLLTQGFTKVSITRDLAGKERVVEGRRQ